MRKRLSIMGATFALLTGLLTVVVPQVAHAAVGPGADRELTVPANGWWTYTGITAAQVSSTLSTNNARLTDIQVNHGATETFTVTEVANSGAYASGWYWYYDATPAQIQTLATNDNARPTVFNCAVVSGNTLCATIMISNTGANAASWTFWVGSISFINSKLDGSNRVTAFDRIQGTSNYTAVLTANSATTGGAWWYYAGQTGAQVSSLLSTNHARIVDLSHNDDTGTFNVVMDANTAPTWLWYYNDSISGLVTTAVQNGQRLFDVTPYVSGGTTYYAGVMVNNMTPATAKVYLDLAGQVSNGNWGFELKQVQGAGYAGLLTDTQFEPASSIKVLFHYKSILAEQKGQKTDNTNIVYHTNPADPNNGGICPDNYSSTLTTKLLYADTQMMQNSDNRMTKGIADKYTRAAMLAEASRLGMTHTVIQHDIGCPTPTTHNETSLSDLAKLYTDFQTGKDITDPAWRTQFTSRMLNQSNYSPYYAGICPLVQTLAAQLGKSSAIATSFCAAITWIAKGGSYQYAGSLPAAVSYSNGSLTGLPYKKSGVVTPRYFFYGDYFDESTMNSTTQENNLGAARNAAYQDALSSYIVAALKTWH